MLEVILGILATIIIGILSFILKEQWNQIKLLQKELASIKEELMKRSEIIAHVDNEINKLKSDIKEDSKILLEIVTNLDNKLTSIYELLINRD